MIGRTGNQWNSRQYRQNSREIWLDGLV